MFSACPEITSTRHEANVIVDDLKTFDSPAKADAILRSKNSKGFGVLKSLLFLASLVFDTMFSSWEVTIAILGWEDVMKAAPLRNLGYCQETVLLSGQYYQKLLQWRLACHAKVDRCSTLP